MQKFGLRRCMQPSCFTFPGYTAHVVVLLDSPSGPKSWSNSCTYLLRGVCCWLCSKEIDVSRLESCNSCTGSGIKSGTSATTCGTCGGSGQVVQAVRTPLGVFQQVRAPVNACICSCSRGLRQKRCAMDLPKAAFCRHVVPRLCCWPTGCCLIPVRA